MRTRVTLLIAAPLVLAALAGCGGGGGGKQSAGDSSSGGGSPAAAAAIIPGNAPLVISINTDFGGDQASKLKSLGAKFPGQDKLLKSAEKSLGTGNVTLADLEGAVGPETDIVFLDLKSTSTSTSTKASDQAVVGLTQPKDAAKLNALLDKDKTNPTVHEEIDGWTVFSGSQALIDRFKQGATSAKLADSAVYKEAADSLPKERLLTVYVDGAAAAQAGSSGGSIPGIGKLRWGAFSASAADNGIGFEFHGSGAALMVKTFETTFLEEIPGSALVALVFNDLGSSLGALSAVPQLQKTLGSAKSTLGSLSSLLGGPGALYVGAGSPLPEVTLGLNFEPAKLAAALAKFDALLRQASKTPPTTTKIAGVGDVKQIALSGIPIYYGTANDRVIISTGTAAFSANQGGGNKLVEDPLFKEAAAGAGLSLPARNTGVLYLNIKDLVPLIQNFAQLSGTKLPADTLASLAPVQSLLAYARGDGNTVSGRGFIEIK